MQEVSGTTVAEIAANSLPAVRIFERLGIDYCCGGKRPLDEVCQEKGLDPAAVRNELDAAAGARQATDRDWTTAPLRELADHIVRTHHEYLKCEFQPLAERLEKVYRVYNERYGPTLTDLPEVYAGLRSELEMHMFKEERILFPAIAAIEAAAVTGTPAPRTPFGPLSNPIGMMEAEHDSAGQALARIREITGNFALPEYACVTYRALMSGLRELEQDLHLHIHLENNILFPRAVEVERSRR
ncbi:MAG: iron-sulfur cluster repair di-iron protein [Bryobacterales bacterium]|nr:iron-sulfur cluster repair di-iron protein [Bryobacterales bacterium]